MTPLTLEKAGLAETDALLCLLTTAGLALTLLPPRPSLPAAAAGGLCLGLGALVKGPIAPVLYAGSLAVCVLLDRSRARLRAGPIAAAVAGSLAVPLAWVAALALRVEGGFLDVWSTQLGGEEPITLPRYLADRWHYVEGLLPGYLPSSALLLVALATASRKRLLAEPALRTALAVVLFGALFFLVYPRSLPRYAYPIAPWACLLAGAFLGEAWERAPAALRSARWLARAGAAVGIVVGACALAGLTPWFEQRGAIGALAGTAGLASGVAGLRASGARLDAAPAAALLAALLAVTGARAAYLAEAAPLRAERKRTHHQVDAIEAFVPAGAPLHWAHWAHFNTLSYLEREIVHVRSALDTPVGGYLLLTRKRFERDRWWELREAPWSELLTLELGTGDYVWECVLLRRGS